MGAFSVFVHMMFILYVSYDYIMFIVYVSYFLLLECIKYLCTSTVCTNCTYMRGAAVSLSCCWNAKVHGVFPSPPPPMIPVI